MKRIAGIAVVAIPLAAFLAAMCYVLAIAHPLDALAGVTSWFDPLFLIYDVLLLGFAVLFIPLIASSYILCMKDEKARRIQRELGPLWKENEERVNAYVASQFRAQNYIAAVAAMMIIVAFGGIIILVLKPVWGGRGGLDFSRGANLLLLGPGIEGFSEKSFHLLTHSLTAFAFGFLGAYVYSMTQLVRGYFTTDLNAGTFVAASTRMLMASAVALVVAFGLSATVEEPVAGMQAAAVGALHLPQLSHEMLMSALPLLMFFFGYFPNRGVRVIDRITSRFLTWMVKDESWGATSLNKISGMNINHAFRLEREGFDNAENLACADPVELAMRTGFPFAQVRSWIDEARLLIHLGDDFLPFVAATGIRTYDQLCLFAQRWDVQRGAWYGVLAAATGNEKLTTKLQAVVTVRESIELPLEGSDPAPPPQMISIRGGDRATP